MTSFRDHPHFWLASESFDDAPEKQEEELGEGTIPPISKDFKSPWTGKKIDKLVQWLQAKPENIDLNARHFAVLDNGARDDPPTMVVCRVGDQFGDGDKVFMMLLNPEDAANHLRGADADVWVECDLRGEDTTDIEYDSDDALNAPLQGMAIVEGVEATAGAGSASVVHRCQFRKVGWHWKIIKEESTWTLECLGPELSSVRDLMSLSVDTFDTHFRVLKPARF